MAGVLKPTAAGPLILALKAEIGLPIHFHTHDTSGIAGATVLAAIDAGAEIVDAAMDAMAGNTSQPCLGAIVESLHATPRDTGLELRQPSAAISFPAGARCGRTRRFPRANLKCRPPRVSSSRRCRCVKVHQPRRAGSGPSGLGDAPGTRSPALTAPPTTSARTSSLWPSSSKVVGDLCPDDGEPRPDPCGHRGSRRSTSPFLRSSRRDAARRTGPAARRLARGAAAG